MEELKVKGIVLSAIDYKEKDKLLTIYSLELGIITASLKGVKNSNAKLKFASQPFCFAEFIIVKRSDTYTVINAELIESFYDLTLNYSNYIVAQTILEILSIIMQPYQINEQLFLHTIKILNELTYNNEINENISLIKYFLLIFANSGYTINFDMCNECNTKFVGDIYFDFSLGNLTCKNCSSLNSIQILKQDYSVLKIINNTKIEMLHTLKFKNYNYGTLLNIMAKNFSSHFNKSLKVLNNFIINN